MSAVTVSAWNVPAAEPSKLEVSGETVRWPIQPKLHKKMGRLLISNTHWKTVLAALVFGVNDNEDDQKKYAPTFRSLFAYFVRRQAAGAFLEPVRQASEQLTWDQQVAVSFLIGFDWTIPQAWQRLRDREKVLSTLKQGAKEGAFGELIGKAADLRTQLTLAEERCKQLQERVATFMVLPEYYDLENEASRLTREINDIANQNALDRQFVAEVDEAVQSEMPPPIADLEALYKEARVLLPAQAIAKIDDVRHFHESIISNRKSYLQQEMTDARQRIAQNVRLQGEKVDRRATVATPEDGRALDHYSQLQGELTRLRIETERWPGASELLRRSKPDRPNLKIERTQSPTRLRQDHHEQGELYRAAIVTFEELSSNLYEKPGSLTIGQEESGPNSKFGSTGRRARASTTADLLL